MGAAKQVLAKKVLAPSEDWVVVGRMAEFAPGVVREVSVGAVTLAIRSQADGLWVERAGMQRVALRTESGGVVLANLSMEWPDNRMLSHLTGEPTDVESVESRDEIQNRGEDR